MISELIQIESPGEILAEELSMRHWSQSDFAHIIGRPAQFVSEVIAGKKEITREAAAQIGAATGQSPEYWLNLQNSYLLRKQGQNENTRKELSDVALRARMNELAPVSHLRKIGVLQAKTLEDQRRELEELFQIQDINDDPVFPMAARRTNVAEKLTPTQLAWLTCARKAARQITATQFDRQGLRNLAAQLTRIAKGSAEFITLPSRFAAVGVRLVYVAAFPSSKLDGASFLLDEDPGMPVIALSGRGKRLDKVLFTLLHEIAHIIEGHVLANHMIIDEGDQSDSDEKLANKRASEWALPAALGAPPQVIRREWIEAQATRLSVHPLVVIGQLQYAKKLDWRSALVRDAATVTDALATWQKA